MEVGVATIPVVSSRPHDVFVAPSSEETPYRLNTEQFYGMIEASLFPDESRVFLWEGMIYERMAKTQAHAVSACKTLLAIVRSLPDGWFPCSENPVTVSHDKASLPDISVLRGKPDDYFHRRPEATDVALVMEVAQTILRIDTGTKLEAFARAGVPAYWVVNLIGDVVQVYSDPIPTEGRFAVSAVYTRGQSISLLLDNGNIISIAVNDLLPVSDV